MTSTHKTHKIPNIGSLSILKGQIDNVQLSMFDAVPLCTQECCTFDNCPYADQALILDPEEYTFQKCQLRIKYLDSISTSLLKSIKNRDELKMHQLGMMLIPLYSHLCSFKILEYSLNGSVMSGKKVHPIYKEIRETIKLINSLLSDLCISASDSRGLIDGNSDYYEKMVKDGFVPEV